MELNNKVVNKLANSFKIAEENTYKVIQNVIPELKIDNENSIIEVIVQNESLKIDYFIECIFETICEFSYIPVWFLKQKYIENENIELDFESDIETNKKILDFIDKTINFNLLYIESLANGDFLRPTQYLYEFMNSPYKKYKAIPFNMISHDVSKMEIYLDCLLGKNNEINEIIKELKISDSMLYPPKDIFKIRNNKEINDLNKKTIKLFNDQTDGNIKIQNLNEKHSTGFKCVDEKMIKISGDNTELISHINHEIKQGIRNGERETYELKDYSGFFAHVETPNGYVLQFPDLIIPVKRGEKGYPKSIAIEMELTAKGYDHYPKNLIKYKNNIKFGAVVWFCGDKKVKQNLINAYKEIGGTGFTQTYIFDYIAPRKYDLLDYKNININ